MGLYVLIRGRRAVTDPPSRIPEGGFSVPGAFRPLRFSGATAGPGTLRGEDAACVAAPPLRTGATGNEAKTLGLTVAADCPDIRDSFSKRKGPFSVPSSCNESRHCPSFVKEGSLSFAGCGELSDGKRLHPAESTENSIRGKASSPTVHGRYEYFGTAGTSEKRNDRRETLPQPTACVEREIRYLFITPAFILSRTFSK